MNLTISPNFTQQNNNIFQFKKAQNPHMTSYANLAPLAQDTVSFGATKSKGLKKATEVVTEVAGNALRADKVKPKEKVGDFNYEMAFQLNREAQMPAGYVHNALMLYFKKFDSSYVQKDKQIQSITTRVKEPESIWEKLEGITAKMKGKAREHGEDVYLVSKEDANNMLGDVIGNRIVLRDGSKKTTKMVFDTLAQMVRDGRFKITEIEVYRPMVSAIPLDVLKGYKRMGLDVDEKTLKAMRLNPDYLSYADSRDVSEFAEVCREFYPDLRVVNGQDLPNGYPAIHVGITLPDGSKDELQIMDRYVETFKDLVEDDVYKAKGNKTVRHARMKERLKPLGDPEEKELMGRYVPYTRWTYIGQRLKALLWKPMEYNKKVSEQFLVAPKEILDRGLGFNQLAILARADRRESRPVTTMFRD